ncbi:WecB/TagA/CpsF family glycosyltransferase [Oceanidesulfovibrio marinus]|nr:WecB/TagA/CpsF family glycosyltransferase [Oceanidesulfovibrio marinus]QJT07707.1 WecB/TagA/CpsF family glycosyltransferase [Oceanidesulfovibrio marinus]
MTAMPKKYPVFGVLVSATTYDEAATCIMEKAAARESCVSTYMPVHSLMLAARNPEYRAIVNSFELACPDGQPVRHALAMLHGRTLPDRVYGPQHMLVLCERAARQNIPVYLYGSTPRVVEKLGDTLRERFPGLDVAYCESPPFRTLSDAELIETAERFNASGAGLFFIGLGCPRQDEFAARIRDKVHGALLCVGAAFDFHAGEKPMAPAWMQRHSLEWLFRLCKEPRRLFGRYFVYNSLFLAYLGRDILRRRLGIGRNEQSTDEKDTRP